MIGLYPPCGIDNIIGMRQNIIQACIEERPGLGDDHLVYRWAAFWAPRIASDRHTVSGMLTLMVDERELPDDLLALFGAVLAAMRMSRENREKDAAAIFALVDGWLDAKAASHSFDSRQKIGLCRAFIDAGLEPPDGVRLSPDVAADDAGIGTKDITDITELMRDLIPDDVTGYPAYMILREAIGAMPRPAAVVFVTQMLAQDVPKLVSVGRYFLLDPVGETRTAAAQGLADLAQAGGVDAGLLSDLIQLRKWIPDPDTKRILDRGIKESLRREPSGGTVPRSWTLHRLVSSLPDGTGSQSILASVSCGSQKCIAALLLKTGHGIKDAYAIPCSSASDQRRTLAEIEASMPMHAVPVDYLPVALAAALGEGLAGDLPPAPGFLDVAEMLGLRDIAPSDISSASLAEIADPDAQLAGLSAAKRGQLIGRSISWVRDHEISSSWFVSDAVLSLALEQVRTERQATQVVWAHLESQRGFWSSLFARSAAILRHGGGDAWLVFAAVAHGLDTGRALKKIPIFEMIVALTLDVAEQDSEGLRPDGQSPLDDLDTDDDFSPDIAPESNGELERLLRKTPLSPDLIDGYLTAVIVAPRFVTPTDWLPPLLGGIEFPGDNKVQRVLDIIMLRYGVIQDGLFDGDIGLGLRTCLAHHFKDWLAGFAQASTISAAWPKRALSKDDQKILKLIKDGGSDDHIQSTLKPLLPSWLAAMAVRAVDG
jgi:yecA family protein